MTTMRFARTVLPLVLGLGAPAALAGNAPATYDTPQDALDAMIAALAADDSAPALFEVFGNEAEDLLSTGNPDRDAENGAEIRALLAEGYRFRPDTPGQVSLLLGADGWPFPIPISKSDAGWAFDLEAGRDEIFFRRIGENELHVIDVMAAYVEIQSAYRQADHDGDGVLEFAGSILSSPGKKDGLFWELEDGPFGERIARAALDGYSADGADIAAEPYGGYYYRILDGQGENAPGGAMSYRINDHMLGGHAFLAVPSDYGVTGIHSFLVAENGVILEADLGEDSLELAFGMRSYDPDATWSPVD